MHVFLRSLILIPLLCCLSSYGQDVCQPYPGYRILIVGDSWSQIMNENHLLSTQLSKKGYNDWNEKGDKTALAGSTAAMWADPAILPVIKNELIQNPNIEVVVLLIGGNDLLAGKFNNGWYVGMTTAQETALYNRIEADIRTIITGVKSTRPGIQVLICGYDYLNFVYTIFEPATWVMWDNLGQPTPRQINDAVIKLEQRKINIANEDPDVHYVQNLGRMHRMYGYDGFFSPNTSPLPGNTPPAYLPFPGGYPDFPTSPNALGGDGSDPIHLSEAGYTEIAKQLVNLYFLPRLKDGINATYYSKGLANDGFVKPNNTTNTTQFRMGRDAAGLYRNIVTFNTSLLPDNAIINSATIFLTRSGATLTGFPKALDKMDCHLDIKNGYFGAKLAVEAADYAATASAEDIGCFVGTVASNATKLRIEIDQSGLQHINNKGNTQFRFYLNESLTGTVYYTFYDGDATSTNKPVLEISYSLPGREEEKKIEIESAFLEENVTPRIFPNPLGQGSILHVSTSGPSELILRDMYGRTYMSIYVSQGENQVKLPEILPAGMYFVTLQNAVKTESLQVIIAR